MNKFELVKEGSLYSEVPCLRGGWLGPEWSLYGEVQYIMGNGNIGNMGPPLTNGQTQLRWQTVKGYLNLQPLV